MTQKELDFIKRSNKIKFYNENSKTAKEIELSAVCGVVERTLYYKYN